MSINNFGRDIKALRTKRKIGSRELSRLIGKAETYISQLERGLIKKSDYNTAYAIMKHLEFTESSIDDFLYNFYQIKSPKRIESEAQEVATWEEKRAAEIEELLSQKQKTPGSDQEDKENKLAYNEKSFESEWMIELTKNLERKNEEIKMELLFNINNNAQTFEPVVQNLHFLLKSIRKDRENFNFFVELFNNDLSILSKESKERILKVVKEEING
ncbi:helix-turn-helix domain-containing protein [Priestia sp. FSL R5-0680]|uniref:helix-turn-helix domain-containing protein n=1 Tax=Priestia sp. FSL R5-0680 TaxID=2921582 RepID=UPI0030F630CF